MVYLLTLFYIVKVILFAVFLIKICSYSATDCNTRAMDMVFMVATASSMQSVFNNVRSFMASLVQPMSIGTNIRVGLVT